MTTLTSMRLRQAFVRPAMTPLFLLLAFAITACAGPIDFIDPDGRPTDTSPPAAATENAEPAPMKGPQINRRVDVPDNLQVAWLIPWDGIRPIYKPEFAPAEQSPLQDDELIIGVAWDGEAKAYPISVLRSREMVNDELAGIPTLVTW